MSTNYSRVYDSAVAYEQCVFTTGVYTPSNGASFKGLLISTDGDLNITGTNDVEVTFPVVAGLYPFAGNSVIQIGTTATIAVVLF
jgi:hypothetical protein